MKQAGKAQPIRLMMTGQMGSGKSFAADYLQERYGARRWSRTELMKQLAHAIVDQIGNPDPLLESLFTDPLERSRVRAELLAYRYQEEPGKPRRLYQDITEICQQHDPLCFERELAERIRKVGEGSFALIDDVRKKSAFDFFADLGYTSLRIAASENKRRERMLERDGYLPDEATFLHPSETELVAVDHDVTIHNEGEDLPAFYTELDDLVIRLRQEAGQDPGAVDRGPGASATPAAEAA